MTLKIPSPPETHAVAPALSAEEREALGAKVGSALLSQASLHEYAPDSAAFNQRVMEETGLDHDEVFAANTFLIKEDDRRPKYARPEKTEKGVRLIITDAGKSFLGRIAEEGTRN